MNIDLASIYETRIKELENKLETFSEDAKSSIRKHNKTQNSLRNELMLIRTQLTQKDAEGKNKDVKLNLCTITLSILVALLIIPWIMKVF